MVSFMNMSSCYWYSYVVMQCFVVSGMSLQSCYHESISTMFLTFTKSESVNITCYAYLGAIIFSVPFWLMFSKGVSLSALEACHAFFPWLVHVACCLLAVNFASWCCFWHVSIFTKSVKLISFALLPCLFEPVLLRFSRRLVFMFCQASLVHHLYMPCWYVGVK